MRISQTGRSMVEMLGVLAIIGVLSVGAIAGYSKAMMKHKLNKQAEQLNFILTGIQQNLEQFSGYTTSTDITSIFEKLGFVSEDMKHSDGAYYDIFGNKVMVNASSSKLDLQILVNNSSIEVCQNIYTVAREYQNNLDYLTTNRPNYVYAHGPAEIGSSYCKTNKKFFTDGANDYIGCVTNLDTLTIMKLCTDKNTLNSTWGFFAYYVM